MNYKVNKDQDEDDEDDFVQEKNTLGYFVKAQAANQYTVNIDEPFVSPSYYRSIVSMLMNCSELDTVIFLINSPGGMLSGLLTLLEGLKMTEAQTIAVMVGECASAASMFALHCDTAYVSDNATMLCHNISYGTGGKGSDILSHVQHVSKTSEKLLRKTYEHFLTQDEINEMINGREIYLDSEEIKERLDKRQALLEAQEQEEQKPQPKKTKRTSKKTEEETKE
jgi:ATP-dependent protease ClpP protease subunit